MQDFSHQQFQTIPRILVKKLDPPRIGVKKTKVFELPPPNFGAPLESCVETNEFENEENSLGEREKGLGLFYGIFFFCFAGWHGAKQKKQTELREELPLVLCFLLASIERVGCYFVKNSYLLAPDSFFVEMIEIDYDLYEPFILVDFDTSYTEVCKLRIVMVWYSSGTEMRVTKNSKQTTHKEIYPVAWKFEKDTEHEWTWGALEKGTLL